MVLTNLALKSLFKSVFTEGKRQIILMNINPSNIIPGDPMSAEARPVPQAAHNLVILILGWDPPTLDAP